MSVRLFLTATRSCLPRTESDGCGSGTDPCIRGSPIPHWREAISSLWGTFGGNSHGYGGPRRERPEGRRAADDPTGGQYHGSRNLANLQRVLGMAVNGRAPQRGRSSAAVLPPLAALPSPAGGGSTCAAGHGDRSGQAKGHAAEL